MAAGTWLRYTSSQALLVSNDMSQHRRYLVSRGLHYVLRLQQLQCEENTQGTQEERQLVSSAMLISKVGLEVFQ